MKNIEGIRYQFFNGSAEINISQSNFNFMIGYTLLEVDTT